MQRAVRGIETDPTNWEFYARQFMHNKKLSLWIWFPWAAVLTTILIIAVIILGDLRYDLANTIRVIIGGNAFTLFFYVPSFFIIDKMIDRWYGSEIFRRYLDLPPEKRNTESLLMSLSIREKYFLPFMIGSLSLVVLLISSLTRTILIDQLVLIIFLVLFYWLSMYLYHRGTYPTIIDVIQQTRSMVFNETTASNSFVETDSLGEIGRLVQFQSYLTQKIIVSSHDNWYRDTHDHDDPHIPRRT